MRGCGGEHLVEVTLKLERFVLNNGCDVFGHNHTHWATLEVDGSFCEGNDFLLAFWVFYLFFSGNDFEVLVLIQVFYGLENIQVRLLRVLMSPSVFRPFEVVGFYYLFFEQAVLFLAGWQA